MCCRACWSHLVLGLLLAALVLPIAIVVCVGVGTLLSMMGDEGGGQVLGRIALAGGILWALDLIGLVLAQAAGSVSAGDSCSCRTSDEEEG